MLARLVTTLAVLTALTAPPVGLAAPPAGPGAGALQEQASAQAQVQAQKKLQEYTDRLALLNRRLADPRVPAAEKNQIRAEVALLTRNLEAQKKLSAALKLVVDAGAMRRD